MHRGRLGLLTLGQAPREDVTPTFRTILGPSVEILERGGLDGLSGEALAELIAREGEPSVETRLRTGAAIALRRSALLPRLVSAARQLTADCHAALLLCSGEFPALEEACPGLIQPIHLLRGLLRATARHRLLGLIGPESDLVAAPGQWAQYAPQVICAPASPYGAMAEAMAAGRILAGQGAELIFLDDMGFSEEHRKAVAQAAGCPVLCATTSTARMIGEMF